MKTLAARNRGVVAGSPEKPEEFGFDSADPLRRGRVERHVHTGTAPLAKKCGMRPESRG